MTLNTSFKISVEVTNVEQINTLLSVLNSTKIDYKFVDISTTSTVDVIPAETTQIYHPKLFGKYGLRVLQLLSEGRSYKEISTEISLSVDGVRMYIKKIFKVLNVNNGRDAVRIYLTQMQNNQ